MPRSPLNSVTPCDSFRGSYQVRAHWLLIFEALKVPFNGFPGEGGGEGSDHWRFLSCPGCTSKNLEMMPWNLGFARQELG